MSDQTPVSIVGARLAERWVCDGCGKAMRYEAIRTHVKWCAQNPTSRRCPTCAHFVGKAHAADRCAVEWLEVWYDAFGREHTAPYCDRGCTKWVEL